MRRFICGGVVGYEILVVLAAAFFFFFSLFLQPKLKQKFLFELQNSKPSFEKLVKYPFLLFYLLQ